MDFDLSSYSDERQAAQKHMTVLSKNDIVVYDRGYFSYAMLYGHITRGIHPIFRIKAKASEIVDTFIASSETDAIVDFIPSKNNQTAIRKKHADIEFKPIPFRLVKYTAVGTTYVLGTTLLDQKKYTIEDLSDVYHSRWGIEELYKISKNFMDVEDFHGQSERGVKQELFAHFVLITLTRIFSNHSEDNFNSQNTTDGKSEIKANS